MNISDNAILMHAAVKIEAVDNLLWSFFCDYFEESDFSNLKREAEYNPIAIMSKILAIMEFVRQARIYVEAVHDPANSKVISSYIKEAAELQKIVENSQMCAKRAPSAEAQK